MGKPRIISTKKLSPLLVEGAKEGGLEIVELETIRIEPLLAKDTWDKVMAAFQGSPQTIVFTSSNAVEAVSKYLHPYVNPFPLEWKVYCLSGKTLQAVQKLDHISMHVQGTADNATGLAQKMISDGVKQALFFCGEGRRDELPSELRKAGVQLEEVALYRTVPQVVHAPADADAVLFFSPSGAGSFFEHNQLKTGAVCFAIGSTTAGSIKEYTQHKVITSSSPDPALMLEMVKSYFNTTHSDDYTQE